jgi:hypothetical protein
VADRSHPPEVRFDELVQAAACVAGRAGLELRGPFAALLEVAIAPTPLTSDESLI